MALDWKAVEPDHVQRACAQVAASTASKRVTGIVVWYEHDGWSCKRPVTEAPEHMSRDQCQEPRSGTVGHLLHPSYPAGHATIAGACVTVLKAFFEEAFVVPQPVAPDDDGLTLHSYAQAPLTVGGELNKLAANVSPGRDTAGAHWRSDGV
jgi:hypothetical protein